MDASPTGSGVIRYQIDADSVVVLTIDDPDASENRLTHRFAVALHEVVERVDAERDKIAGVVIASDKDTFFSGSDLDRLVALKPEDGPELLNEIRQVATDLRRLDWLGKPVVAAIGGSALGPGLEIALACHRRIACDLPNVEIGLPEIAIGLMPGVGGVARTVRLFGIHDALSRLLLSGRRHTPSQAREIGLVDDVVSSLDALIPAAKAWISQHTDDVDASTQPWDLDDYAIPGGAPDTDDPGSVVSALPSSLRRRFQRALDSAPPAILDTAIRGARTDIDTALDLEAAAFVGVATDPLASNMIQGLHVDMLAVTSGTARPRGQGQAPPPTRAAVLGAGMMGAGIGYALARAGIDVVLKDVSTDAARHGKEHVRALLDAQVETGRITAEQRDGVLSRITATADVNDLTACDLVVEAVFEDPDLKRRVFAETERVAAPDALLCSNTSTLPISDLAAGVSRPTDLIGLHFFSPVDKMPLVEIIVGAQTSDATLARTYDLARRLGKTPIVINDSRGFFTSRVFGTLVMEAAGMLAEGIDPATIERAATTIGFPAPPLAMLDEISLTLCLHIRDSAAASGEAAKLGGFGVGPGLPLVDRMVGEFGRTGRAGGGGFYDYPRGEPKRLWAGLMEHFVDPERNPVDDDTFRDLQERLTFAMSLETIRCVQEGVLRSTAEANVGSILGIGFPSVYGGALQYVSNYVDARPAGTLRGVTGFAERARELAATYGDRFAPPRLLEEKAEAGQRF